MVNSKYIIAVVLTALLTLKISQAGFFLGAYIIIILIIGLIVKIYKLIRNKIRG